MHTCVCVCVCVGSTKEFESSQCTDMHDARRATKQQIQLHRQHLHQQPPDQQLRHQHHHRSVCHSRDMVCCGLQVCVRRPIMRIPTLAIHLDRGVNQDGFKPNFETHLAPVLATQVKAALDQPPKKKEEKQVTYLSCATVSTTKLRASGGLATLYSLLTTLVPPTREWSRWLQLALFASYRAFFSARFLRHSFSVPFGGTTIAWGSEHISI